MIKTTRLIISLQLVSIHVLVVRCNIIVSFATILRVAIPFPFDFPIQAYSFDDNRIARFLFNTVWGTGNIFVLHNSDTLERDLKLETLFHGVLRERFGVVYTFSLAPFIYLFSLRERESVNTFYLGAN